jgi:GT2 family glycosyltransferase
MTTENAISVGQFGDDDALVSVVILSYNRPQSLRRSLECVFRQTYRNLEVLVMDNASSSPEIIREVVSKFPSAKLYVARKNVGYTGGMNAGVALASGKYVYLTEDDMYSDEDCLSRLVDYIRSDPSAGIVSGTVLSHETGELVCCGGQVRLDAVFRSRFHDQGASLESEIAGPYCAGYTTGGMMFFEKKKFVEMGGFRDDFFMYYEDTELCLRCRKNGDAIVIVPQAIAHSLRGGNGAESRVVSVHKLKNFLAMYLLHARPRVLPEFLFRYVFLGGIRSVRSTNTWLDFVTAIAWVVRNSPGLLRERLAGRQPAFTWDRPNWNLAQSE